MASDVLAMLRKKPDILVSRLCDGAPEMWNLLDEAFDADSFKGVVLHQLIDFWHAVEKLAAAAGLDVRQGRGTDLGRAMADFPAQPQRRP